MFYKYNTVKCPDGPFCPLPCNPVPRDGGAKLENSIPLRTRDIPPACISIVLFHVKNNKHYNVKIVNFSVLKLINFA